MRRFKTLTVGELRELLSEQDDDALVIFSTDYGDHCHTEQALPLKGEIEERTIGESGYSNSGFALIETDEDDDEEDADDDETDDQVYLVLR